MPTLRQHLSQRDSTELRIIAQNQGLTPEEIAGNDLLTVLTQHMLQPGHVQAVWQTLPAAAKEALGALARSQPGVPVPVFQRRYGELRRFGPGKLQLEQPWKQPIGPGEKLWYLGWLARGFQQTDSGMIEFISIPQDLTPLLPLDDAPAPASGPALTAQPTPETQQAWDDWLLDDAGTLLAYVQNHRVWLRSNQRWRLQDLTQLQPRLRLSARRKQPLEAGGPLHLLFFSLKKLGLLTVRQRQQRFGKALRPWLEQSRAEQMYSLFQTWRQADDWNDLCLTPGLHCQAGAWRNDPILARKALLEQLAQVQSGRWYDLDEWVALVYEQMPDFQRPDGLYDTWYIQNAAGAFLRGFEHWPAVEGRLIRYLWQGPLFWLGVVALDATRHAWSLTPQGRAFLNGEPPAPSPVDAPTLRVTPDFHLILAPEISVWDRLRVALFAFWESSLPEYRYRITRRGLKRAAQHGVSAQRILDFLQRASHNSTPNNVRKALERFSP